MAQVFSLDSRLISYYFIRADKLIMLDVVKFSSYYLRLDELLMYSFSFDLK